MAKSDTRVATMIPGFDNLVQGGFPRGASVLLSGGPGTGKTIFAMQYLINGASKGERVLYVSFEQPPEALRTQAAQFGWNLATLEKKGLLTLMCVPAAKITKDTIDNIAAAVKKGKIKRVVLDSLSTLVINAPIYNSLKDVVLTDLLQETTVFSPPIIGEYVVNKFLYGFIDQLRALEGCTSLLISEVTDGEVLGEYVCDGVVQISFESLGGDFSRSLIVRKMRATKNDEDVHPVEIGKKGIVVHTIE